MDISGPAALVRVNARSRWCITLVGLPPDDTLHISLLAEILGWRVDLLSSAEFHAAPAVAIADPEWLVSDLPADPGGSAGMRVAVHPVMLDDLGTAQAVLDRPAAPEVIRARPPSGRLMLQMEGLVIRVTCDDCDVKRRLAAMGLDRLVTPVPLQVLEDLLAFAA